MNIKTKCRKVTTEIGIPVTKLCRCVGISSTTYYRWLAGDLKLSEETENRIKDYIKKFDSIFNN